VGCTIGSRGEEPGERKTVIGGGGGGDTDCGHWRRNAWISLMQGLHAAKAVKECFVTEQRKNGPKLHK